MKNKLLICILGKSSSGKDTLTREVSKELGIPLLVSHTTRNPRSGEEDGVQYHFVPDYIFDEMEKHGDFIETTTYYISSEGREYDYGYSKRVVNSCEIGMCIVNPHGLKSFEKAGFNIVSVEIYRDDRKRLISSLERDENVNIKELFDRYQRDENDFEDLATDYIVFNDGTMKEGIKELETIVKEIIMDDFLERRIQ